MNVYVPTCTTSDPDTEDSRVVLVLGVFSTLDEAKEAFTAAESRVDSLGSPWVAKHSCFKGNHHIEEFELGNCFKGSVQTFYYLPCKKGKKYEWRS